MLLLAPTLALAAALLAPRAEDPRRQFDFWVGEWSVQNRHLQPDGSWRDGDVTRARITPVCGGTAVLEEWAGDFRGAFMNGFSLRAWDPDREDWALLLFWTTDGNGGFGTLRGRFRHGRGEFFAGSGATRTRYTFSDALPDSVRWDSARTTDAGVSWKTDWIMEFSRTRAADEVTQDALFATPWTEGELSPHAAARALDGMLGTWSGTQTRADGTERAARLRCKLLNRDCLVLDVLATRPAGAEAWDERLAVRAFVPGAGAWERWTVRSNDSRLRRATGRVESDLRVFERADPATGDTLRETIELRPDGRLAIVVERVPARGPTELVSTTALTRE